MEIRDNIRINTPMPPAGSSNMGKSVQNTTENGINLSDSVDISTSKVKPEKVEAKVRESSLESRGEIEKPVSGVEMKDLAPMPKDLYKVSRDGKTKKVTFIYDTDQRTNLTNLKLVGSWDKNSGHYTNEWKNSGVEMKPDDKGRWIATVDLENDSTKPWEWGVLADGPSGKQQWAVFEEGNLKLDISGDKPVAEYAPTTYTRMGAMRDGESINFKFWSPHAKDIKVKAWDENPEDSQYVQLKQDPKTGMWSGGVEGGWKQFDGKKFCYEITTSEGKTVHKNDPYARYLMGQQRGVTTMYLHPKTGRQVHQYYRDPELENQGKRSWEKYVRFEVQDKDNAEGVYLKLSDESGKPMNREDLLKRLGDSDPTVPRKFHEGKFSDFWLDNIDDSGKIKLTKQGKAWASIMNNPDATAGMKYQFEVHEKGPDGQIRIVGDTNMDGVLSTEEAKKTNFNDPYSDTISENYGWERFGIIKESNFEWKNCDVPREKDINKMIIGQIHVGSVFGDAKNVQRSTLKDVMERLEFFKEMGVNTIETLPLNSIEGSRDWGYIGTASFAMTDQYGFEDNDGNWVSGTDAVKMFVDAAHGLGMNVINDVVYNHWGGDFNNMWNLDGRKNPYFDWEQNPAPAAPTADEMSKKPLNLFKSVSGGSQGADTQDIRGRVRDATPMSYRNIETVKKNTLKGQEGSLFKAVRHTDWGAMPAYNKEAVSQFVVDNAMAQLDEFKFDGLRFDFTHPIHASGWGGGTEGWNLLRKINKQIHFFHPNAVTAAEEFPNEKIITTPAYANGQGGAGFDQMWNTEFQHRLVHDHNNPAILQEATKGWRTDMDKFMRHMMHHPGFTTPTNSVTVISNHDEVGNAARTINVATDHKGDYIPDQWARGASRFAFGVGMYSPGTPMFFQGEESLAENYFSWGRPETWDVGWDWKEVGKDWNWKEVDASQGKVDHLNALLQMPESARAESQQIKSLSESDRKVFDYLSAVKPEERDTAVKNLMRRAHFEFCKDSINLRRESVAFDADAQANWVYTHNDNSVMAYTRRKDDEEFLVVGSLNKNNMADYNIPLNGGKWELVLNSDSRHYGGNDYGSKIHIDGNQGTRIDLPAGGLLVYKRVG